MAAIAPPAPAQGPQSLAPGFATTEGHRQTTQVAAVRGAVAVAGGLAVAIGGQLQWHRPPTAGRVVWTAPPGDDIGCLGPAGDGVHLLVSALRSGKVYRVDPATGAVAGEVAGVPQAFDLAALAGGEVLLSANPQWPAANAHTGVWLAGPGRAPREILPLTGPSGPLLCLPNGDLVVGELGPTLPPGPGAARLLRLPAARLQAARQGATLGPGDVAAVGTGFAGLYDLALDDQGRLYASDPASPVVAFCGPGSLVPAGSALHAGAGMFALGLQFEPSAHGPFAAYQPPAAAGSLWVATTDFASQFALVRLHPARPALAAPGGAQWSPGPAALPLQGAPPGGFAALCASLHAGPEVPWPTAHGALWLALPATAPLAVWLQPLDAAGHTTFALTNPGGFLLDLHCQAAAFGPAHAPGAGTSPLLTLHLLP